MPAKEASFDVVSELNMEEVKNAVQIALKEIRNRFDFKDTHVNITIEKERLVIVADDNYKLEQVKDVLLAKLIKRKVPIKNIHFSASEKALGGSVRQSGELLSGIDKETAKKMTDAIKKTGLKVTTQIQDTKIRVASKSRDALQDVLALIQKMELPIDVQVTNYR